MKRFLFVIVFCASLIASLALFLFPVAEAADSPLLALLNLPAPPAPNPQVGIPRTDFPEKFYSKSNPPPDDAPIEDLMAYWLVQSTSYSELGYNPKPSEKVLDRLLAEVEKAPEKVHQFLNAFRESKNAAELVKKIYDRTIPDDENARNSKGELKRWLMYNGPYFSAELARGASRAGDQNEYVSNQQELLALGRVDWDRARPIVDRLYAGNQKVSRVLALWALYRRALDDGSPSDTERYREELKAVVEDKTATAGMRDLAFDALVKEKEWSGRDEWYYTLLSDETLDELRVNGSVYTGLTTIMYYSPEERYVDRMVELVQSENKAVRKAAAKNLLRRLSSRNPEVVRALLPWLEDPKWINADPASRNQIVAALETIKLPESVPALIAALDEKGERVSYRSMANANMAVYNSIANAANAAAYAANAASEVAGMYANAVSNSPKLPTETYYPLRDNAIGALANQGDSRAVPALRRILNATEEMYAQNGLVAALLKCGGFTIPQQVDALEYVAKNAEEFEASSNISATPRAFIYGTYGQPSDINRVLGIQVATSTNPSDELARAVVDRITYLDRTDPTTAGTMRRVVLNWSAPAVNALLLRDLKNNRTDLDTIVRLLTFRKELREKQPADVSDIRTGSPMAVGISACLLEDPNDYVAILNGTNDESKTAMLACARLIRAPLPVQKVAQNLGSKDRMLVLAATRYLESEDSPEARRIVLSLHPNEARILGSRTVFGTDAETAYSRFVVPLFVTVNEFFRLGQNEHGAVAAPDTHLIEIEKRLQEEVRKDPELLGVYGWEKNFVHVYKDRAMVSWHDDPARYRERVLTRDELDNFKNVISHYDADKLPAFLGCVYCESRELLMLGRSGGRRVYVRTETLPPLFAELDRMFQDLRTAPSTIKYWATKDVPGLEVLFASDRLNAMAVWKEGTDLRLLASDTVRRDAIDTELESFGETFAESDEGDGEGIDDALAEALAKERLKREYESFAWFTFSGGELGPTTTQPANVDYIPVRDNLSVEPEEDLWKAQAGTIEIRADDKGLYKVSAGKLTKIKTGYYRFPRVTPNGRWVVASKFDDNYGSQLVRVNLLTNKEVAVDRGELPAYQAVAYVSSLNRFLVGPPRGYYGEDGEEMEDDAYAFLDPETGVLTPARGEVRPLGHQTFRALQPAAKAFEFWAAIPNEDETVIGIYNSRTFTMTPVLKLPKISFNSMDVWADEAEGKVYFVYEGHLLAAPIKSRR